MNCNIIMKFLKTIKFQLRKIKLNKFNKQVKFKMIKKMINLIKIQIF